MIQSEPQRRHLRVYLDRIEAAATEVVQLARTPSAGRALAVDDVDLPVGFAAAVAPELDRIRRDIRILAARFGLEPERRSRLRRIQALLSAATVAVQDAGSRSLTSYGVVSDGVAGELDPVLDDIAAALDAMIAALPPADR